MRPLFEHEQKQCTPDLVRYEVKDEASFFQVSMCFTTTGTGSCSRSRSVVTDDLLIH